MTYAEADLSPVTSPEHSPPTPGTMKPTSAYLAFAFVLLATFTAFAPLRAQDAGPARDRLRVVDSTRIQVITMRDGSSLIGRIVSAGSDSVDFQMGIGRVSVAIKDIREISEADSESMHDGEYWFPNPNSTRLFFAPTGQMLKKGEGYFSDYMLIFPGFAYGVTDNVSIGGGVSLIPGEFDNQIYYFTPKVGVSLSEKVHVSTGFLLAGTRGGTGGIGYGVGTFGDGDASATVGLGWGFAGGEIQSKPLAMLGGEARVSRRIALVSENYLLPIDNNPIIYSFGVRFLGEKLTTDLALVNSSAGGGGIGIPYVDFVFKF